MQSDLIPITQTFSVSQVVNVDSSAESSPEAVMETSREPEAAASATAAEPEPRRAKAASE